MEEKSFIFTADGTLHVNMTYSIQNLTKTVCQDHGHIPHNTIRQFLTTQGLREHSFLITVSAKGVITSYPTAFILEYLGTGTECKVLAPLSDDQYVSGFLADWEHKIMVIQSDGSAAFRNVEDIPMCVELPTQDNMATVAPASEEYQGVEVVTASMIASESSVLIVTENGYAKKIPVEEFCANGNLILDTPLQCFSPDEKTGAIICGGGLPNDSGLEMLSNMGRSFWIDSDLLPTRGRTAPPMLIYNLLSGEYVDHLMLHT